MVRIQNDEDADGPISEFTLPGESAGQGDPGFNNLMKNLYGKHDFMNVKEKSFCVSLYSLLRT